ncbi:MAG: hypothetical protein JWQ14_306 [Adhaeribacter sp.]|nr:hypothetical protein [Adhaeribacter sp.]
MNTTENLHQSFAWLSGEAREKSLPCYDVSDVLNLMNISFFSQFGGLEVAADGEIRGFNRFVQNRPYDTATDAAEVKQAAPEEVYFLTQVILNTLNTVPERFHDMFDIPGLETEGWELLANVAQYLITQGWIEPKAVEEKLLVKLTIEGKIYLRNSNAWS